MDLLKIMCYMDFSSIHHFALIKKHLINKNIIYPEICNMIGYFGTILRVEHKGKWYKQVYINYSLDELVRNVYFGMLYGRVDPNLKSYDGEYLFIFDENCQLSEKDRTKKSYFP